MRAVNTTTIALLGLSLGLATADGGAPYTVDQLKGIQTCGKCNPRGMSNFCESSSFEKGDKKEAVRIADCKLLMEQVKNTDKQSVVVFPVAPIDANQWNVVTVSKPGNCGFALKAPRALPGEDGIAMGTGDVYEIVRDAISRLGEGGKVVGHGQTYCRGRGADGRFADRDVAWKLFNPYG
ncbi:hypothetical protein PG985_013578 [Apiospora marii]|uniref:uncharacterized protein n=1 Tax=Apiospora marii TaxID=335849 RepID=UPI00313107B5